MFTVESLQILNSEIENLEKKKVDNEESLYRNSYEIQANESRISELRFIRELNLVNSENYKFLKNQQQRDLALEEELYKGNEYQSQKRNLDTLILEKNRIICKISYLKAEIASKRRLWDLGILSLQK